METKGLTDKKINQILKYKDEANFDQIYQIFTIFSKELEQRIKTEGYNSCFICYKPFKSIDKCQIVCSDCNKLPTKK